jgi:hypothetical protein
VTYPSTASEAPTVILLILKSVMYINVCIYFHGDSWVTREQIVIFWTLSRVLAMRRARESVIFFKR